MKHLEFKDKILRIDDKEYEMDFLIMDARVIDGIAVVLYHFPNSLSRHEQFKNCRGYDDLGNLKWIAEHPINTAADFYTGFTDPISNKLWNFSGFICELDFSSGKLIDAEFTK